jgi:hypothetical protein
MTTDPVKRFLRTYEASAVGATPPQPGIVIDSDEAATDKDDKNEELDRSIELDESAWKAIPVDEAPAKSGEYPLRFIDGSQATQPVLAVKSPQGWPIPMLMGEVGAVALKSVGRRFERQFVALERVLSFVGDPFPWEEVEAFAAELANKPEMQVRVLLANRNAEPGKSPFDYEVHRSQARGRILNEMRNFERLAFAVDTSVPTLVDGPLHRLMGQPDPAAPLRIGIVKTHSSEYLHEAGMKVLLELKPGNRTPIFKSEGTRGDGGTLPVASWYLKLAGGPRLAPNWGFVRVEIPWGQFERQFRGDVTFINRLSRWLIDARCRTDSYARMPVSLDPIVRAEDSLKPLFSPMPVLMNRFYRTAGFFRGHEG